MVRVLACMIVMAVFAVAVPVVYATLPPPHYRFDMMWGDEGEGNGQFSGPMRLNIRGNYLLVGDRDNNRVQMFTLDGVFVRKYGTYGTRPSNLHQPFEADFDASGRIFIADCFNGRIIVRDFNLRSLFYFGSDGRADEQVMGPRGVAIDRERGWVYIADTLNDRISKWTTAGQHLFNFASTGAGPGELNHPYDIAVGADGVYVADTENNRIQVFDTDGNFLRQWNGSDGGGNLAWPPAVGVARNGNVFVADGNNNRIVQYTASGEYISAFGGYGSGPGQFDMPAGIAIDNALRVYVSDGHQHRIERFRLNQRPTVPAELKITPGRPSGSARLTASASGSVDADGDPVFYGYRWCESTDRVTWSVVRDAQVLPASFTHPGRWYRCEARAWDGYDYTAWVISNCVSIPPGS